MENGRLGKLSEFKGFMSTIRALGALFEKADRKALTTALKGGDLKGVCTALHVNQDQLTGLLRQGAVEAAKVAKESPDIAVDALRQNTANGPRS